MSGVLCLSRLRGHRSHDLSSDYMASYDSAILLQSLYMAVASSTHTFMRSLHILGERQQTELHKAIVQYLEPVLAAKNALSLFDSLAAILLPESTTSRDPDHKHEHSIMPNYLEKKWLTVTRLQRKIMDLETELGNLRTVIDSNSALQGSSAASSRDKINWLPFAPLKSYETKSNQAVQAVAVHPLYPTVLAGCADGTIVLWTLSNDSSMIPDKILSAHARGVNCIAFLEQPIDLANLSTSKLYVFASCSSDLSIKVWDGSSFAQLRTLLGHEHTVSSIAFSPTHPQILYSVSRDKTVKLWDVIKGICLSSFVGHSEWVRDVDVTSIQAAIGLGAPKLAIGLGDFVLTCSNDLSARLSHAESGTGIALLVGHTHVVETCKFLPAHSSQYLDDYLKKHIMMFPTLPPDTISDPVYTEQLGYKYCVTALRDNSVKIWLLPPPKLVDNRPPQPPELNGSHAWLVADLAGHTSWVKAIAVHPNGRFIFSGSDDEKIIVWDLDGLLTTGSVRIARTLQGHDGFVTDLAFARLLADPSLSKESNGSAGSAKLLQEIESRIRCIFISGGSNNCLKLWS